MRQQDIKIIAPLSHGLPKTGQSIKYADGDDGDYEVGWWLRLLEANNRTRFVEREYVSGEPVIIDLATRVMWPKDFSGAGANNGTSINWEAALVFCNNLVFGGSPAWHLPNIKEFQSIIDYGTYNPAAFSIFDNVKYGAAGYWSSTTRRYNTAYAWQATFTEGTLTKVSKATSANCYVVACRSI